MADDQDYTLFPPEGPCSEALPAQTVQDEYTFVQLAPIEAIRNGKAVGNLTIAKDVIAPHKVAEIHRRHPELPYDMLAKGPTVWLPEWRKRVEPPGGGSSGAVVTDVKVDDIGSFIASPKVSEEAGTRSVQLEEDNVRELLRGEPTYAYTAPTNGGKRHVVRVVPSGAAPFARAPVVVQDAATFLATGRLTIDGQQQQVKLSERNIDEFSSAGITALRLGDGETATTVYAVAASVCGNAGGDEQPVLSQYAAKAPDPMYGAQKYINQSIPPELLSNRDLMMQKTDASFFTDGSLALYLPYRVTWKLLGYSRGELLNTISLIPDESATIEITTWDRLKQDDETTSTSESQFTSEASFTAKRTAEAVNDLAHQHNWGLTAKGDVSIPMGGAKIGAGGTWNDSQSMTDTHKGSVTVVKEGLRKVAAQIKATRQTKVSMSRETGFERKATQHIKNHNLCHTLDVDYFEILASYEVSIEPMLDQGRICLLVDNPIMDPISTKFVLAYEPELRQALLSADQVTGFDAVRMLAAFDNYHMYDCKIRCPEPCPCDKPPVVPGTEKTDFDPVKEAEADIATIAKEVRTRIELIKNANVYRAHDPNRHDPPAGICALARDYFGSHPAEEWDEAKQEWRRWLFREVHLNRHATGWWSEARKYLKDQDDSPRRLELLIKAGDVGWASVVNQAIAAIFSSISLTGMVADLTWNSGFNMKPLLESAAFDDAGLDGAMSEARASLERYNTAKAAAEASKVVEDDEKAAEEAAKAAAPTGPWDAKVLAEARVAQDGLLSHLTKHECYYRQAVWARLGADDRLVILHLLDDVMRNAEPELVGFLGNKCALPLRLDQHPEVAKWTHDNLTENAGLTAKIAPITVTVPTPGVTTMSRLGGCSTCEDFIETHRELDLEQKRAEVDAAKQRAEQEKFETKRYEARLGQDEPLLDDPDPNAHDGAAIRVALVKDSAAPVAPAEPPH